MAPDPTIPGPGPIAPVRPRLDPWAVALLVGLVGLVLVGGLAVDGVGSPRFYRFVVLEAIPVALIALPLTFVIITGEIDLSVASTVGLSCVVFGELWHMGVTSLPLLVAACLLLGAVLGAVNGTFVTVFGLPSLAVTIGTLALYRGLAFVVLGDRAVADYPAGWTRGAISPLPGTTIPWFVLVVAVLAVLACVVLYATPVGRAVYAVGNGAEAAAFSGVAVARTRFWLFVATGMVSAGAGVFWTLRFASARADNATGLELTVVAAVLLGGVSIFGGRGGLLGVIAAVALLGTMRNALQLADVPANALTIVTGSLLILSVVGPNLVRMARERLRRRRPPGPIPPRPAPAGGG